MHVYVVEGGEDDRERILQIVSVRRPEIRCFKDGTTFLDKCAMLPAGVVIIDICLPDLDGLELQRQIKRNCEVSHKVVMLAGDCEVSDAVAAMREGAIDFLEKPVRRAELLDAVVRAELALCEEQQATKSVSEHDCILRGMTDREIEVLKASAHGQSSKEVAYDMGLSTRTIEMHRSNIIKKLGVTNFASALVLYASGGSASQI